MMNMIGVLQRERGEKGRKSKEKKIHKKRDAQEERASDKYDCGATLRVLERVMCTFSSIEKD